MAFGTFAFKERGEIFKESTCTSNLYLSTTAKTIPPLLAAFIFGKKRSLLAWMDRKSTCFLSAGQKLVHPPACWLLTFLSYKVWGAIMKKTPCSLFPVGAGPLTTTDHTVWKGASVLFVNNEIKHQGNGTFISPLLCCQGHCGFVRRTGSIKCMRVELWLGNGGNLVLNMRRFESWTKYCHFPAELWRGRWKARWECFTVVKCLHCNGITLLTAVTMWLFLTHLQVSF